MTVAILAQELFRLFRTKVDIPVFRLFWSIIEMNVRTYNDGGHNGRLYRLIDDLHR
jgi:hypothetical protein